MPELQSLPKLVIQPESTKAEIRTVVWKYLEDNDISTYPKIPRRRITNFIGSDLAGQKISEMDLFKKAKILRIDPDKPLQEIRFKTLEAGKTLLVPTPKLKNHVFSKIVPPQDCPVDLLKNCAARQGVQEFSEPIELEDKLPVDLVIVGCIAVSTKGWRIGKGGGLSDLEFAMMADLGVLSPNVPVITMVHDSQVIDELPDSLFGPHDLPVDYIVTPTRIIECTGHLAKPKGIIWSLVNQAKIDHVPVLKRLRYRKWKIGGDVKLSGEEETPTELVDVVSSDDEHLEDRRRRRPFRGGRRPQGRPGRRRKEGEEGETTGEEDRGKEVRYGSGPRRRFGRNNFRNFRNSKGRQNNEAAKAEGGEDRINLGSDGQTDDENRQHPRRRRFNSKPGSVQKNRADSDRVHRDSERDRPRRPPYRRRSNFMDEIEGSIYVGSLPRNLRVSEFKSEVRDRNVNPIRVMWKGGAGFAFLNFKTVDEAESALAALEGLHICDKPLKLEMAKSPTGGRGGGFRGQRSRDNQEEASENRGREDGDHVEVGH